MAEKSYRMKRVRRGGRYYVYVWGKDGKLITVKKWSSKKEKREQIKKEIKRKIRVEIEYRYTVCGKRLIDYFSLNSAIAYYFYEKESWMINLLEDIHNAIVEYYENFMDILSSSEGLDDCSQFDFSELEELNVVDCDSVYGLLISYSWDIEKDTIKYYLKADWVTKRVIAKKGGMWDLVLKKWGFKYDND